MRTLVAFLVLLAPLIAQDAQSKKELLDRARELEQRAEKALDSGRRAEAFTFLAEAAELRARAKGQAEPKSAEPGEPADKKPPQKKQAKNARKAGGHGPKVKSALERFDEALESGDLAAARREAGRTRELLAGWERSLAKRERGLDVEGRVARIERDLRELRRQIEALARG